MHSENIQMLQIVAHGLEDLKDDMVFVGGAVAELYTDDPSASEIRPTFDIDCVNETNSRKQYSELEEILRTKGFINDNSKGAPICRWIYKNVKVDIMPTDPNILGFTNQWYTEGTENKISTILPDGTKIFIFPIVYYLATKFEAHKNRGGNDFRQSHDFEDIIYILDNSKNLLNDILESKESVKKYLKSECQSLINNSNITEYIESALPYGTSTEGTSIIMELIQNIANI